MIDRQGQVWETPGKELWLIVSSASEGFGRIRHETLILTSRVAALNGHRSWHHEHLGDKNTWETPRFEDAKGWRRAA